VPFLDVASAQEDPLAWFPLQVGSHWVYEHEANRATGTGQTWTAGPPRKRSLVVTIPEGLVVLREVKQQQQGQ